jgi:hypothetical protein
MDVTDLRGELAHQRARLALLIWNSIALSLLEQMVESGVDFTLVAVVANTQKVLEAIERLEAGLPGAR